MSELLYELLEQPAALRNLAAYYQHGAGSELLAGLPSGGQTLLTGMGASYHVAMIGALMLQSCGQNAIACEASELINYSGSLLRACAPLIYISQSGSSGEVAPTLAMAKAFGARVIGLGNHADSVLGRQADISLLVTAGAEELIASKTYLNSLALVWLMARQWAGSLNAADFALILRIADQAERILAARERSAARLMEFFAQSSHILFLGHGPHAVTARQAAMTMAEWPKRIALHFSIGAFRHGFIETAGKGSGVILFAAPGKTAASAESTLRLGAELAEVGAQVLVMENGALRGLDEPAPSPSGTDEFLSPMLDILPIQCCAEAMARADGRIPGFRYISKIVSTL